MLSSSSAMADEATPANLQFFGFIELKTFVSTDRGKDVSDAVIKNELRCRLEMKYGADDLYLS